MKYFVPFGLGVSFVYLGDGKGIGNWCYELVYLTILNGGRLALP